MKKLQGSRILFAATDLLGSVFLWGGIVFTIYGLVMGFYVAAIWSASFAGSGLSILIITHIGKALINIAETNNAILKEMRERA